MPTARRGARGRPGAKISAVVAKTLMLEGNGGVSLAADVWGDEGAPIVVGSVNTISGPATSFQVDPQLAARFGFTPAEVAEDATSILSAQDIYDVGDQYLGPKYDAADPFPRCTFQPLLLSHPDL